MPTRRRRHRPRHQVSSLPTGSVQSLFPFNPHSSTQNVGDPPASSSKWKHRHFRVTIDLLPDDILLEIFDHYVKDKGARITQWHTLAYVCRRWREIVFASPHRLNLRLEYTGKNKDHWTKTLRTWPHFPIVVSDRNLQSHLARRWNNMAATLDSSYHDRISEIEWSHIPNWTWETIATAMQKPFPALTKLVLSVRDYNDTVIPDSFLGGSAPSLHTIGLRNCAFPGMLKLLSSAKDLVTLSLEDIPDSGYISPDAIVTALSLVTRLESLHLSFIYPQYRPDPESQPLPPPTRTVLPVLTKLAFKGVHEYSESLMAQIDAPLLENLSITFFIDFNFGVPQLHRFIIRIEAFKTLRHAKVFGGCDSIVCTLSPRADPVAYATRLSFKIVCANRRVDWQLSSLAQVCSSSLSPLSTVDELEIELRAQSFTPLEYYVEPGSTEWLELLGPFIAVKNLTLALSPGSTSSVCDALKTIAGERITEVLPALQNIFLYDGYPSKGSLDRKYIKVFIAARRHSGYPVSIYSGSWGGTRTDITKELASEPDW